MEYVGNEDTLEEASKIKELKNDVEFVDILFRRFHENVLNCFGFKQGNLPVQLPVQVTPNANTNYNTGSERDRSSDRLPPKGNQITNTMGDLARQTNGTNGNNGSNGNNGTNGNNGSYGTNGTNGNNGTNSTNKKPNNAPLRN